MMHIGHIILESTYWRRNDRTDHLFVLGVTLSMRTCLAAVAMLPLGKLEATDSLTVGLVWVPGRWCHGAHPDNIGHLSLAWH